MITTALASCPAAAVAFIEAATVALAVAVSLTAASLQRPLSDVPDSAIEFVVGIVAVAFGTFRSGGGMGVGWPGADGPLVGLQRTGRLP